jgi:hypothetical protein
MDTNRATERTVGTLFIVATVGSIAASAALGSVLDGLIPQPATSSARPQRAVDRASATPTAATHRPTAYQPVNTTTSVPGGTDDAPSIAHQMRTSP